MAPPLTGTFTGNFPEGTTLLFNPSIPRLSNGVDLFDLDNINVTVPSSGTFSVTAVATNDGAWTPTGWTHHITGRTPAGERIDINVALPAGTTVDLASAPELVPSDGEPSGPIFNVRLFGALGIGLDDRPYIQECCDTANDISPGSALIDFPKPPVKYTLGSKTVADQTGVTFYDGQCFRGDGSDETVITVADNFGPYLAMFSLADPTDYTQRLVVRGITFDQNAANDNAQPIPFGITPTCAVYAGSFDADSFIEFDDVIFANGDNVNAVYLFSQDITFRNVRSRAAGGPVGTDLHDHSTIYTTTTVEGGSQIFSDCHGFGVLGSGGAATFIETHGGSQLLWGCTADGYMNGFNLTSIADVSTPGISFYGGAVTNCMEGMQLWAEAGDTIRNVIIDGLNVTIDRESWLDNVPGLILPASAFRTAFTGAVELFGLRLRNISSHHLPLSTMTGDDDDCDDISIVAASATIHDLFIEDCNLRNAVAAGIFINTTVKTGHISRVVVTDPLVSTDASAAARGAAVMTFGNYTDFWYDSIGLVDTRTPKRATFCVFHAPTTFTRGGSRGGNYISFYSGVASTTPIYPASNAIATLQIHEESINGQIPSFNTLAGSTIRNPATSEVKHQVVSPSGNTWVSEFWVVGTPEGAVTAGVGSIAHRQDGGAGTCLYVKESGAGNTGWVAK